MTGTAKTRLMVGLFNTADGLKLGLAALRDGHLDPSQIKVIAQPHALNGMLDSWSGESEARGFSTWIVCTPSDGPIPWVLAAADSASSDRAAVQDAQSLLRIHQALRSPRQLDYHLQAGGALLLVEPLTDEEERAAGTALLSYASGGVQTHEISRQG